MGSKHIIQRVINVRTDFSQYLIHWTKRENFDRIIRDGFLIASEAPREVGPYRAIRSTISNPAVCFSETPVGNYLQAVASHPIYSGRQYGLAFHKKTLYKYGARPVIYGNESLYKRLEKEDRYLFCHFDYFAEDLGWIDWTHEREWRVRPNTQLNNAMGLQSNISVRNTSGTLFVPVHFPPIDRHGEFKNELSENPEFVLIVKIEEDKKEVKDHLERVLRATGLSRHMYPGVKEYRDKYLMACEKAYMVSLEEVKEKCENEGLWRLEDFIPSTAD